MIEMPSLGDRCNLPRGLLEMLITLNRMGVQTARIWFLDGLAPKANLTIPGSESGALVLDTDTGIPMLVNALLRMLPPSAEAKPVWTMTSDDRDRGQFPQATIDAQWVPMVTGFPLWQHLTPASFQAWDRRKMYGLLRQPHIPNVHSLTVNGGVPSQPVNIFVRSAERAAYGNLVVSVNPAAAAVLSGLPAFLPPEFFQLLSGAGHSEGVAVVPRSSPLLTSGLNQKHPRLLHPFMTPVGTTVTEVLKAMTALWLPDGHDQVEDDIVQSALAFWAGTESMTLPTGKPFNHGPWSADGIIQTLTGIEMLHALQRPHTVAVVVADTDPDGWGGEFAHWLFTNGVSGATSGL